MNWIRQTDRQPSKIYWRIGDKKAAGLNAVPDRALKLIVKARPEWFIGVLEVCMVDVFSPSVEKAKASFACEAQ